jgi:hypothetical protein
MDYGEIEISGNKYYVKEIELGEGVPRCFCLYNYAVYQKPCGYALVFDKRPECQLWHIWTKDEVRNRGYASSLIDVLKAKYLKIVTQIETREGKNLCLKNGFKLKPANTKNDDDWLIWEKGAKNG